MRNTRKLGLLLLLFYTASRFLTSFANFQWNSVFAAEKKWSSTNNIIAILVDKKTLPLIQGLDRYTTKYLPQKYPNSKALVLSIDPKEYSPFEIQKLLENLYFEGETDKASALIWLIILWEIPLPVVKYNDFIFPSIYPYVDFLEQKYLRDEESQYFTNQKNDGQAEIWHGIINFKNDATAYQKFFEKLKKYHENPEKFIDKKIRYDDYLALQNNFLEENYKLYTNKLTFAEDIAYHRYTDLLVNTLQAESDKEKAELTKGLPIEWNNPESITLPETKTPTKFLQEKLKALTQDYSSSISFPLQRTISENVAAAGRRNQPETHYQKLQLKDELNLGSKNTQGIFKEINDKLENFVDEKIKKEKYAMNSVIPILFKNEKQKSKRILFIRRLIPEFHNVFRFFYFGKDAEFIEKAEDASIYRGTFRNLNKFWNYSSIVNNEENPARSNEDKTELKNKSFGASYDVFSQQTEGNRGFNMLAIPEEYQLYEKEKKHKKVEYNCTRRWFWLSWSWLPCSKIKRTPIGKCNPNAKKENWEPDYDEMADCENFEEFWNRIWWGASPLNATGLTDNNYRFQGKYDPKSAWKPIFDIAGSVKTKTAEPSAYSFLGLKEYLSPTQTMRKEWAIKDPIHHTIKNSIWNLLWILKFNSPKEAKVETDYFKIELKDKLIPLPPKGQNKFKIIKPKKSDTDEYREYIFKTLDTTIEHKSATRDQINGKKTKKYDEQSEAYQYFLQLSKALDLKKDSYSNPLLKSIEEGQNKLNQFYTKIENAQEITESPISEQEVEDFWALFENQKENFKNYTEMLSVDYSFAFKNQIESIINQQIEKNPKIWLLNKRYESINQNFIELEKFFTPAQKTAKRVFESYKNLYEKLNKIQNEVSIKLINLKKQKEENADSEKIKQQIKKWEKVEEKMIKIKEKIDDINQATSCESYHENLWWLIGESKENIKNTGHENNECKKNESWTETDKSTNNNNTENPNENILANRIKELKNIKNQFSQYFFSDNNNPEITIPGMNHITPDRPIDSPRYVSFEGIGKNEIKLIYPNIFKVETFNLSGEYLSLKTNTPKESQFKKAIESYLKNKVNEYNTILNKEKVNAAKDSPYFQHLKKIDPLATPTLDKSIRPYQLFTYEEFLNAIWGEKMLNTLAQLLYYQNVWIQNRIISDDILQDIQNTKNAFNINEKIEYLNKNYLSQNNDQFIKKEYGALSELILPNYEAKWYEVGFINSSENDLVSTSEVTTEELTSEISNNAINNESLEAAGDQQTEKECWFNYNEALLVFDISSWKFPWVDGLLCWFEEVKKKPFELKLIRENNPLIEWLNEITDINASNGLPTSTTNYQELPADKIAGTILENIQITTAKQKISVEEQTGNTFSFQSLSPEAENVIINFKSAGENCILIDNKNTCHTKVSKTLQIWGGGASIPFSLANTKTTSFHTTVEICQQNGQKCGRKTYNFTTTPGQIDHFDIKIGENNNFGAGIFSLLELKAFDKYKNPISKTLENYTLKTSKGGFIIWGKSQDEIEISDFNTTTIIYQAPLWANGPVHFSIYKSTDPEKKILGKNTGNIVPASFEIHHKGKKIKNLNYQINDLALKINQWNREIINPNKAYKLEILLKDANENSLPITTRAKLHSKNNLIETYLLEWESRLKAASSVTIKNWKADFYLMSKNIAGIDEISIVIPGLAAEKIKVEILPGAADNLSLNMSADTAQENTEIIGTITITDKRWNIIQNDYNTNYNIITPGGTQKKALKITKGKGNFTYIMQAKDSTATFQVTLPTPQKTLRAQKKTRLKKSFLDSAVQSGLNIMYLNYFGSDWGNQRGYFSEKNRYGEEIIQKSDKTLAITTQLVDLKKIGKPSILLTKEKIENIEQTEIFANFINQQNIELTLPKIGKVQIIDPILESITLNDDSQITQSIKKRNKASIIVYDINPEFIYKKKKLYLKEAEDKELASRWNGLSLKLTNEEIHQTPIWDILWNNQPIGKAVLTKLDFSKSRTFIENKNYALETTFYKGSTYNTAKGIFNQLSVLQDEYKGYDSIQNSDDMNKFIGFRGNFKNISSFAAGMSVGEATIPFGSEFLINLWDPALTRKNTNTNINNTNHNWGLGKIVYSDEKRSIFKVMNLDYNNDGLEDLIIIYNDGTIKLQKQYNDESFDNLENLLITSEQIDDIFIGDVDGNKYKDIIIKNTKSQIRSYLNNKWEFDVDGKIACLNTNAWENQINQNPETQKLHQLFVQDMDLDGITDILTYDLAGDVKIFYGAGWRENHSYLSKNPYKCDPDRFKRQASATKKIKNLGTSISPSPLKDESLVRRPGLKLPTVSEIKNEAANKINQNFPASFSPTLNHLNILEKWFSSSELAEKTINTSEKYILNPFDQNIIDDGVAKEEQAYIAINKLETNTDPIEITKTFRDINGAPLLPNDKVQVTINIKANKKVQKAAFFDRLQWPWKIKLDDTKKPENFKFLKGNATFHPQISDSIYYLTDINLEKWENLLLNYTIDFNAQAGNAAFKINVEDINADDYKTTSEKENSSSKVRFNKDNLPDIEISPSNACTKEKEVLFNKKTDKREYQETKINLQKLLEEYNKQVEARKQQAQSKTAKDLQNVQKNGLNSIPWFSQIWESMPGKSFLDNVRKEGLKGWIFDFGQILNLEDLIWDKLDEVENKISDLASKACNGFSLWSKKQSCKGLPVPFNQAFLAPGNYHIMWCIPMEPLTQTLGKGLPIFHFPGTLTTPLGPIPFPRGQKGATDEFLWVWGGAYPSMIRIYAAPTLTAQLGIAICLGPQTLGSKIPSPFADLGGNCIVTSVALPCGDNENNWESDWAEELEPRVKAYKDLGSCTSDSQNSPFVSHQNNNTAITFEKSSLEIEKLKTIAWWQEIPISDIKIWGVGKWGAISFWGIKVAKSYNTIRGGNEKGIKKIVGDFLYNQIEYIKNNLLRRHINLYLPDFGKLNEEIQNVAKWFQNLDQMTLKINTSWIKNPLKSVITKEDITQLWLSEDDNPFLQIKKIFNQSQLINISTQNIPVHIPRIYGEDIEAYGNYLKTWLKTQESTLDTWQKEIKAIIGSCPVEIAKLKQEWKTQELQQKLQECQTAEKIAQELLKLTGKFDKISKQIRKNIETLELYKRFPFEIYEWLHIVDKYMAEISGVINNFFGYLNFWMDLNASRFSQYVDAIITILAVVKTYQILIDITANRSSKCWTCTNDTYDQYTCKLGFLCNGIKIDPIPIPSIKIPNLTIDLSHTDTSLDIVLPNFQFIPKSIELPRLPNIPLPPTVGLRIDRDFNLPNILQLPEPPTLPELPSLLPQVKLKLPILPPAPKIPELPKSITATLKIIEKIGKIYCIIKQGFWLVGENSVKAKIEQMTQRTYDVPRVDYLDLLANFEIKVGANNLKGLDYGIESHLNLQYNFDQFYAFLKWTADAVNNYTDIATNFVSEGISNQVSNLAEKAVNKVQDAIDASSEFLNVDVNISPDGLSAAIPNTQNSNPTKEKLAQEIELAMSNIHSTTDQEKLKQVLAITQKETTIQKDGEKIKEMKNQISSLVSHYKNQNLHLAQLAKKDYKEFLLALEPHNKEQKNLQLSFNANLLKDNKEIENIFKNNNIYDIYIASQEEQIDGYLNALSKHTPEQLNMSPFIHQKNSTYLKNIKQEIKKYYLVQGNKKSGTTHLNEKNGIWVERYLYAQNTNTPDYLKEINKAKELTPTPKNESPDYSHYVKGVLLKTNDNSSLINVVNSEHNYEQYQKYYEKDMNNDGKADLILRDQNTVYIKYANDFTPPKWGSEKFYHIDLSLKNRNQKYEKTQGISFKVYDEAPEVKNFMLKGQTFDTLSFSWRHNQHIPLSWYVMRISDRIDNHLEKTNTDLSKYMLFLPKDTPLTGIELVINEKSYPIATLLKNGLLYNIKYYNPEKDNLTFGISEIPRKRQYLQIASIEKKGNKYLKNSPRSNQELGGRQVISDTEPPVPTISLLRSKKNHQIEDQGNQLEWRVGSYYDLAIQRKDNVEVDKVALKQGNKTLISTTIGKKEGEIRLSDLFFTKAQKVSYILEGKDSEGNTVNETITLNIKIPKIKIENITRLTWRAEGLQKPVMISTSIEQEIDQGVINFQRKRNEGIKEISAIYKGKEIKNFPIKTDQTQLTGQYFDFGNLIGLYSADGKKYGTVNAENGEIKIDDTYTKSIQISVPFNKGYPVIQINENEKKLFEVILKAEKLIKAIPLEGKFLPLKWKQYGLFDGGQSLIYEGKTMLFISKNWAITTNNNDLIASYRFNPQSETVTYIIKEHRFGKDIAEIKIKTLPL